MQVRHGTVPAGVASKAQFEQDVSGRGDAGNRLERPPGPSGQQIVGAFTLRPRFRFKGTLQIEKAGRKTQTNMTPLLGFKWQTAEQFKEASRAKAN